MNKILLAIVLLAALPAHAKGPKEIGSIYARIDMCAIAGKINKVEKGIIFLKVSDKYDMGDKPKWFKKAVTKGQLEEFKRINQEDSKVGRAISCGVLKSRWLKPKAGN